MCIRDRYTTDDIKWSSDGNTGTITTKDGKTITVTLAWAKGAEDAIETAGLHSNAANVEAVSYTHLRAHETEADLVCRLLLEKKKRKKKKKI
ncbi:hypothetical protein [Lactobacillus casei subsp. casei ATCC 393] [Lacticaseibacillus rhamnosus]|nr:hypothetical protein [Lactobacillus casei subsp. casei ATCC 393] [Lacticaseibacillus rhamnosus]